MKRRILILAGEASGDQHGARVVEAVQARRPEVSWVGLGGPELEALGVETFAGLDELAVMGFAEVIRHLPFFWKLERQVLAELDSGRIDLVLAVDYPGFNLRIAKAARERGIPVLFYIAPQVWAWKAHRAAALARDADHIAVILPFEPPIFEAEGGTVTFVGHPLKDRDEIPEPGALRKELLEEFGVQAETPLLALLPGSRRQELGRHLELFVRAGEELIRRIPDIQPVLATAPGVDDGPLRATGLPVTSRTRELLTEARVALVKSGTSTLEATMADVPFVMAYRTSALTWMMARRLVQVDHIALANLVAGRRVVPEFLQGEATAETLGAALAEIAVEGERRTAMLEGLSGIRGALGDPGAASRVAEIALELLDASGEGT